MLHCLSFMGNVFLRLRRFKHARPKVHQVIPVLLILVSGNLFAQQSVSGRVTAGDSVLSGATVQVKGGASTQTDASGKFTINAPANGTLIVSYVGFTTEQVRIDNRSNVPVELRPS